MKRTLTILSFLLLWAGCDRHPNAVSQTLGARSAAAASPSATPPEPLPHKDSPARLVAIGDLHGDLKATRTALRLAGAIDEHDHWVGGKLVVVQTGDEVDRADDDRAILDLFDRLRAEAAATSGAVMPLVGNHEVMNVQLNFNYATDGGLAGFETVPGLDLSQPRLAQLPEKARARGAALMPGGAYAKKLAERDVVAVVGDTVFVHGGILPKQVSYGLTRINREMRAWMLGETPNAPRMAASQDGVVWTRRYSAAPGADDCRVLGQVLTQIGASRMVVGHTVQRGGISSDCDGKVWRIDVGMSRHFGGSVQVLEIAGGEPHVLKQTTD